MLESASAHLSDNSTGLGRQRKTNGS